MSDPWVEVVEFTDPWCSWAWGSEPKLRRLRWRHGHRLRWRRVMGDLVDPGAAAAVPAPRLQTYWQGVAGHTGAPWPTALQRRPADSVAASCAVIAAGGQGEQVAARLLRVLRESCHVFNCPADSAPRVLELAGAVPGLDADRLATDLDSDEVRAAFAADRAETRDPNDYVRALRETHEGAGNAKPAGSGWRYVFPTLLFRGPGGEHTVPGWQPTERYVAALEQALPGSSTQPRPDPDPETALTHWGSLTDAELSVLCGPLARPPREAIAVPAGGGSLWLLPDDPRTAR